ncbi:MAG: histidine kinase dimerization/phospho-acceptor domain-containing protein [Candidatus Borkfalkia sp.]
MVWLSVALGVAAIVIIALSLKIFIIKYSLKDVNEQAERKLDTDTNLLILLESGDRDVRRFVRRLNRSLANGRTETAVRSRQPRTERIVTNISHDLRTPLTSAAGYIGLLKKSRLDDKQREYLAVVEGRMEAMKN